MASLYIRATSTSSKSSSSSALARFTLRGASLISAFLALAAKENGIACLPIAVTWDFIRQGDEEDQNSGSLLRYYWDLLFYARGSIPSMSSYVIGSRKLLHNSSGFSITPSLFLLFFFSPAIGRGTNGAEGCGVVERDPAGRPRVVGSDPTAYHGGGGSSGRGRRRSSFPSSR